MRTQALAIFSIAVVVSLSACANSLDAIIDAHHQARIEAANANRPLTRGYGDSLGDAIAESAAPSSSANSHASP